MRIEACFYLYYYTNTNTKILSINVSDAIDFSTSHTHASKKLFSRVFHVTRPPPQTQKFFRNIPKCRSFGATATATATATKGPLTLHGTPAFFFIFFFFFIFQHFRLFRFFFFLFSPKVQPFHPGFWFVRFYFESDELFDTQKAGLVSRLSQLGVVLVR